MLAFALVFLTLMVAPVSAQQTVHVVQPGENLFRIALRYGVGMEAIAQANGITDLRRVLAGQQLIIPNFDPTPAVVENPLVASTPSYHVVQRGENLDAIARLYGLTRDQLLQSNNIANPNVIYPGQQLLVWPAAAEPIPVESAPVIPVEAAPIPAETTYVVQPGEHLAQIARRFGLNWTIIAQANNLGNPNHIYSGQTLIIPSAPSAGEVSSGGDYVPSYSPASPTIWSGKQVVVDLSDSRVYAFQDGVLLRDVLISPGLPATPTVVGDFSVYAKYTAQTMSGPGYYLPDVPYVMYFYQGYSLHGTYWHSNWGQPMSHGCVNMPTPEAEWFFNYFVDVGTPVRVQY
ncbi:MAG: LysM peptidoglycan-binding domain-containing protein [Chloroflexi bacterium]|nr:LysM peptidoglycan-binding domain-containing protein [Chloroflexota bacterium]